MHGERFEDGQSAPDTRLFAPQSLRSSHKAPDRGSPHETEKIVR